MRRTLWLQALTLAGAAVLAGSTVAVAAEEGAKRPGMHQGNRLQQKLGLSEDQTKAIREIYTREAQARKQLGQGLRQAQTTLRRLVLTGGDEASIQTKQTEVQTLMADALQRRTNTLKEIAPILTPEQRVKLAELFEQGGRFRHRGPRS